MNVLIACEYSGRVRRAFAARGHNAWSCDLLPAEDNDHNHWEGDVFGFVNEFGVEDIDLMIAHPPCTHLASSGARWWKDKEQEQEKAIEFVERLLSAPIAKVCLENPIGILSRRLRKPDQIIQPWQFGHGETKATCLWLRGLDLLTPTNIVDGREPRIHRMSPGPNRWKERSRTYQGIADAMAEQWG
jgi:site-specific DNA-cytosine methylase